MNESCSSSEVTVFVWIVLVIWGILLLGTGMLDRFSMTLAGAATGENGSDEGLSMDSQNCCFSTKVKSFSVVLDDVVADWVAETDSVWSPEMFDRLDVGNLVGFGKPEIIFFFSKIT